MEDYTFPHTMKHTLLNVSDWLCLQRSRVCLAHSSHQHDAGAAGYPPYRHEGKTIRGQSLFFTPVLFPRAVSLSRNTRDQTVTAAPLQLRGVRGQSVCSGRRLRGVRVKTPGEARLFISTEPSVGGRRGVLPAHSAVVWATNCTGRKNITQPPRHCVRRKGNHGNRAERLRNRRWLEEGRVRYNPGWV